MTIESDTRRLTREEIQAERVAAGLHPKAGWQSLAETRRILATWTKAELIEFVIREESDSLKASDRAVAAEQALREHKLNSFTMPKADSKRPDAEPTLDERIEATSREVAELRGAYHGRPSDYATTGRIAAEVFGDSAARPEAGVKPLTGATAAGQHEQPDDAMNGSRQARPEALPPTREALALELWAVES